MEYGKQLNPEHSLRTSKGIKGTRQKVIVTHNPSEIDQAQELLVRFPNLGSDDIIIPGTVNLSFNVELTSAIDANRTLDKIYYQPNHLWKGQKAVKKLKELSEDKPKAVKQLLSRQAFWQVHLPAPKQVDRPHYQVTIPNEMHQFDLLYMPSDTLYGNSSDLRQGSPH